MSAMWWFFLLIVRMVVRFAVVWRVVALGGLSWEAEDEFVTVLAVND